MRTFALSFGVAATLVVGGNAGAADFQWHGHLGDGRTIEIKGVNGGIHAVAGSGDVEVSAEKRGRRNDPKLVEIKVVEHANGVTICAVYPSSGAQPNECVPGGGGRSNTHDNDVTVDFEVRVPAGVRFVGRTVNGGIDAVDLPSSAGAYTVNGSIEVAAAGEVEAETVNGEIRAKLGDASGTEPLRFKTVNGSIRVGLSASASANVRAKTLNGDITTDFPLTVQGRMGRHVSGAIGGGGRTLSLETVNGSIELRQGA